jgi:hypothetical protein
MRRTFRIVSIALLVLATGGFAAHKIAPAIARLALNETVSEGNIRIHHSRRDAGKATLLAGAFRRDRERIHADLGYQGGAAVDVWLTTSPYVYNLFCGNPLPLRPGGMRASDGGASPEGLLILIPPDWKPGTDSRGLRDPGFYLLAHEYTHWVINQVNPGVVAVQWLNEGLALKEGAGVYGPGLHEMETAELKTDLVAENVPTLQQLVGGRLDDFVRLHGYTYGHTLVRYIESAYGQQGLRRMIRTPGDIQAALGVDEATFRRGWQGFLRREFLD